MFRRRKRTNLSANQLTFCPSIFAPSFHCLLHSIHFICVLSFKLFHTPESVCCVFMSSHEGTRAQRGYVERKWSIWKHVWLILMLEFLSPNLAFLLPVFYQTLMDLGVTLDAWVRKKKKIFGAHQKYLDTFIRSVVGCGDLHFSKASLVLFIQSVLHIIFWRTFN